MIDDDEGEGEGVEDDAIVAFCAALSDSLGDGRFVNAVLAKYRGPEADLLRIDVRRVQVQRRSMLQFVFHHTTRDVTQNHTISQSVTEVRRLLGAACFRNAHLHASDGTHELSITKRGHASLRRSIRGQTPSAAPTAHNREKHRMLDLQRPFLRALGVTAPIQKGTSHHATADADADAEAAAVAGRVALVPAMARKWKQINKFIEVFASALAASRLTDAAQLNVVDFGSGKGYLTFAVHDWLTHVKGVRANVTGVELRPDMVALCNAAIRTLNLQGLHIVQGDVQHWQPAAMHVMIALHACDTATDHAIHLGVRAGADIILCSPCCHKELRPQLLSPHPMRPILQHGVHLGQQAEMLTDGLRAMLLEAAGYDTQVFEFVSLEHTNKNKMILAVKRKLTRSPTSVLAQIDEIKTFYGIRSVTLETLLRAGTTILHDRP